MKKNVETAFWSIIFVLSISTLNAQGLILDEEVYGAMPVQSEYGDGSKSESEAVQKIRKVSLKPYCPEIKTQGTISSCVGWAAGYGAYSIQQAILNEWRGLKEITSENAFSAMFIYNQVKIYDCAYGARISDALEYMRDSGNVYHKDFDQDIDNCYRKPDSLLIEQAKAHKIRRFEALFKSNASSEVKKNKTKLSLIQNKPVIAGFELIKSFQQLRPIDEFWYPEIGSQDLFGGHAMVVIGFDDEKQAFEIMNSWGKEWGQRGFMWVKYDDYAKYCKHAYQMTIKDDIIRDKIYTAEASLRRPIMRTPDGDRFAYEKMVLKNDIYRLQSGVLDSKNKFQLLLQNVNNGMYAYVFSLDARQQLKIHWPRDEDIDDKFDGLNESAKITVPEVKLVLPTPQTALRFNPGKEHLVILYSAGPIEDFNVRLKRLQKADGDIKTKIQQAFGEELVPFQQIKYEKIQMAFRNEIKNGRIIPVILEVDVEE